jgi:pullulanase
MYEQLGARELKPGTVTFRLFFPDRSRDPWQYDGGGMPRVQAIRVVGDFQGACGQKDWDPTTAPPMGELADAKASPAVALGHVFQWETPLPDGFYDYRYHLTFMDGSAITISDPCSRYGGKAAGNSGVVLGGRKVKADPIAKRLPYGELVIYELNLDDFTARYRGQRAPIDAVRDRLDVIRGLGFNAIEFMPWTAWPNDDFSWGYNPYQYFSVSHRYTNDPARPSDKLVLLSDLVNACHARDLHVIMDGVFNHAEVDPPDRGFGYYWLYGVSADSPFVGNFAAHDFFKDLDYANLCTHEFILDVCKYWIDNFAVDGIRLDNTLGFYKPDDRGHGLPRLLADLREHLASMGQANFALVLEHSWDYSAIDVTNKVGATSCWYDAFRSLSMDYLGNRSALPPMMRMLDSARDFDEGAVPTTYVENHDHKAFALKASAQRDEWWRMQPYLIALFTCPGAVLVHDGQEYANSYDMPEQGDGRVVPRPIDWPALDDQVGKSVSALFAKLIGIRTGSAALSSPNFHPRNWDESRTTRDAEGFGLDVDRQVAVYHRWARDRAGRLERFYVVLNLSDEPQGRDVDLKVAVNSSWEDLLTGDVFDAFANSLSVHVGRCWGRVLFRRD